MARLTPDQRNHLYLAEASRTGIHKPILAALYAVQERMTLTDGETGLGISPVNKISLEQVNTLPEQVKYAANTIRSLTDSLIAEEWQPKDLWSSSEGRYTDKFVQTIAKGYTPPATDSQSALLEASEPSALLKAYLADLQQDKEAEGEKLPNNLLYLDEALLTLIERVPQYYSRLPYQRDALLETVRVWRKLDSRSAVIASLGGQFAASENLDESLLDIPLLQFVQQIPRFYGGFPHQRESLLRLAQLWRQLDSREATIVSLARDNSPEPQLQVYDPALIAFVQRLPQFYQGKGEQRHALVETVRVWRQLETRSEALLQLGINPELLNGNPPDRSTLSQAVTQLDRQLLEFIRRVPIEYQSRDLQRNALIRLVMLWRGLQNTEQTLKSLAEDLVLMQRARKNTPEAPPRPVVVPLPRRPERWTPTNLQIYAAIVPNGNFTWAEATQGGTRMPPDQATVDAIIQIARLAQQARDRIGRPFQITSWYRPPEINARVGGVSNSRHIVGDAIDFYCEGLTGDQLYWFLDPWWTGGLGRYTSFPYLCHIDARGYRARWLR